MLGLTKSQLQSEPGRALEAPLQGVRHLVGIAGDRVEIDVRETVTSTPAEVLADLWGTETRSWMEIHPRGRHRLTNGARHRQRFHNLATYTAQTGGAMFKKRKLWAGAS